MGPTDYGMMLGGGMPQQQQAPMSAPTVAQPGGGAQKPQDPIGYELALCVETIKKCAALLAQQGDEQAANIFDAAAVKLNRTKIQRTKKLEQAFQNVQGTVLPALM